MTNKKTKKQTRVIITSAENGYVISIRTRTSLNYGEVHHLQLDDDFEDESSRTVNTFVSETWEKAIDILNENKF